MTWSDRKKNVIGSVTILAISVVVMIATILWNRNTVNSARREVAQEFRLIVPPPGAIQTKPVDNYSLLRTNQGMVGAYYTSAEDYPTVRRYYDRELANKGWKLVSDEAMTNWGKDTGGRDILYCKPPLYAVLELLGNVAESRHSSEQFKYGFYVSWGSRPDLLKGKCD